MSTRNLVFIALLLLFALFVSPIQADHSNPPETVQITSTFLDEIGCAEDWSADCDGANLNFDETHQKWLGTIEIPAGEYEYKAILNGTFDEPISAAGPTDWPNIPLILESDTAVTFVYNHETHYIADDVNTIFANVPGSFNAEIGCPDTSFDDSGNPGDWAPDCWQTLLEDLNRDGIYSYTTNQIPVGDYEAKVAVGGSWGENYGDGGAPGGANLGFSVTKPNADVIFEWNGETKVMKITAAGAPKGNLKEAAAYWVATDTILTPEDGSNQFELFYSADGSLEVGEEGLTGGESFSLEVVDTMSEDIRNKFPHLSQLTALRVPDDVIARAHELLRGQVALNVKNPGTQPVTATGLQLPGIIDELYTYDDPLGVEYKDGRLEIRLWAPTAKNVNLLIPEAVPMRRIDSTGVWAHGWPLDSAEGISPRISYQFEVEVFVPSEGKVVTNIVTDPYSLVLTQNSTSSIATDLQIETLKPAGWDNLIKPELNAFEDVVLYELHVRDFSIIDETVPENERGTYKAFTRIESNGMQHLARLSDAGLTHVHLLPVFDIATINENKEEQRAPIQRFLTNFDGDSDQQQLAIFNLRDEDGFNWGYDPFHYTVPEGSYATEPNGPQRILEFREMVQALNQTGLRVVMDVVYNHTNASGQSEKSVLDQIVPGYYHRLNKKGKVENSTCCSNTATEHNMMRKLMVDSIVTWAVEYKVDGFRFDLMGHHMKADMLAVRAALDELTLEEHGVNGKAILLYGEGWDFGEVANGTRGINATQTAMQGAGIGTFNDRIRDAVRGGNPFGGEQEQGFATGLLTYPNGVTNDSEAVMTNNLTRFADQIRVGLTGNSADYEFIDRKDDLTPGRLVDYNGAATGYTADPQEVINYVSAHDNETLFDGIQLKLPINADMATRVRYQNFALSIPMLGQGIPFFHAGSEILRSKSMDRDSYNSGDWFNAIDWTYTENNWGKGLPVADKNEGKWDLMRPLLTDPNLKPDQEAILANLLNFETMLKVRASSPLFRLRTAEQVAERVAFHNTGSDQLAGVIVMSINDSDAERIDPNYDRIVVIFNGRNEEIDFVIDILAGVEMILHPDMALSSGPTWVGTAYAKGTFTVPAVTTAVFVQTGDSTTMLEAEFGDTAVAPPLQQENDQPAETTTAVQPEVATTIELDEDRMVESQVTPNIAEITPEVSQEPADSTIDATLSGALPIILAAIAALVAAGLTLFGYTRRK